MFALGGGKGSGFGFEEGNDGIGGFGGGDLKRTPKSVLGGSGNAPLLSPRALSTETGRRGEGVMERVRNIRL